MIRPSRRWAIGLILVVAVAVVPLAYGLQSESGPAGQIGAGGVALTEDVLTTPQLIRAFVPTGSESGRCLVTYGESDVGHLLSAPFCGSREVDGVDGVVITIFLSQEVTDLSLSLTVYQQFAKEYGAPVKYTGS